MNEGTDRPTDGLTNETTNKQINKLLVITTRTSGH